ncbi:hypothetical protein V501_02727 [Pseudogymnoascus sp. VKM F-4519 (FW-2642)]|nr:hypothetical protein V501_02727 [Pseudogymnoascus sp. VKM F-4519 (FW-2642)]
MADEKAAAEALKAMRVASETVRSAIASAIPVANTQVLTVSIPGTVINVKDYLYDADKTIKAPLAVRVNEARLVDGMIPLSKFTTGKTGKSVARSYLSTLDFLAPVEASVSGAISSSTPIPTSGRLKVVRDRYLKAMDYLTSVDDTPGSSGRSKLTTYVDKQTAWAKAVEAYSAA